MPVEKLQAILDQVEQPSRYLGTETNRIVKDSEKIRLHIALAFPDLYDIGTSHFGMQILYHVLNRQSGIAAERVFAPANDFAAYLEKAGMPLMSLESRRPLHRFDIIGFSLLYELNYTNVLTMLKLAGIPWLAADRAEKHPLVIAGGPCTVNPEPLADFFDALVIGDGETVVLEMARAWQTWKDAGGRHKGDLLKAWAGIESVYVPALYAPDYDQRGLQRFNSDDLSARRVTRAVIGDLNAAPFPEAPLVPFARPVHDRLRLEIARGCSRGCRFCQAGMIYRPVRERDPRQLLELAAAALANTGYGDLSLLSLSTGDYGCIGYLLQELMQRYSQDHIAVSLPSLRVGSLTPELMRLVQKVRKTGFTLAPEAGSARLRAVINKNITEEDIYSTVENAFTLGWQVIKLYFMIGLPTETPADLEAIVTLVKDLRRLKNRHSTRKAKTQINVSFTTFIPKSHTPFQWSSQVALDEARYKITWLQNQLKLPGINLKWQNPEVSLLEGLWARGDRRLGRLLTTAVNSGCRFDGWSDQFNFGRWQAALEKSDIDTDAYVTRSRDLDEPLPWDIIDTRVSKAFLKQEYMQALNQQTTPDCRNGACQQCGVCDFVTIQPRPAIISAPPPPMKRAPTTFDAPPVVYQLNYCKRNDARFFAHLEMVNLFLRALQRSNVPLLFSGGFHPKPKVAFEDPLPVGMESMRETFFISALKYILPGELQERLNRLLPPGLHITDCSVVPAVRRRTAEIAGYRVYGSPRLFLPEHVQVFNQSRRFDIQRTSFKGRTVTLNLKNNIRRLEVTNDSVIDMILSGYDGITSRPQDVLKHVFKLSTESIRAARILKYVPAAQAAQRPDEVICHVEKDCH